MQCVSVREMNAAQSKNEKELELSTCETVRDMNANYPMRSVNAV